MSATIDTFSTASGDARGIDTSDAALVSLVAYRGDADAFEILYRRHVGAVTKVAAHMCRNHAAAEVIARQTFLALWERAARLAAKSVRVRPWLTTVARNAAMDYLRSGDRELLSYDDAIAEPAGTLPPMSSPCNTTPKALCARRSRRSHPTSERRSSSCTFKGSPIVLQPLRPAIRLARSNRESGWP